MWKKFLAVMAIVGLLSSSTVFAVTQGDEPFGGSTSGTLISNLAVTNSTFSPANGESTTISYTLAQSAGIYAYVVKKDDSSKLYDLAGTTSTPVVTAAGNTSITWLGTAAANGEYDLRIFAYQGTQLLDVASGTLTVTSTTTQNTNAPRITSLKADPSVFSPADGEDTEISFDTDKDGFVEVKVKSATTTVRTFSDYDGNDFYRGDDRHSINWNGKDDSGTRVSDGSYTIEVKTENGSKTASNTETATVSVAKGGSVSKGVIKDFTLDPANVWDPRKDGEIKIEFELEESVRTLTIDARKGNKVIEIIDDRDADDDDYNEVWDGTDDDGDYIDEGVWDIILRADADVITKQIRVEYEEPMVPEAFVTKESFDPGENEFTTLVFKVDTAADVTIEVYKGSRRELTLWDTEPVRKNRYYTVQWDGLDREGDEVTFGKDWKFKITAENMTENDVRDIKTIEIDIEEDTASDRKSNILNDYMNPAVFDEDVDSDVIFQYYIDEEAEVTVDIYDGNSTTGKEEVELISDLEQAAGFHTIQWDGRDKDNKRLKDGVYSYKVTTKATDGGRKDIEVGRFAVGNTSGGKIDPPVDPPVDPKPPVGEKCGGYWDTKNIGGTELCSAIEWATKEGVFSGYTDGSFGAHKLITRAEVLKTVFEAFSQATILPVDGSNQGFYDVDPFAWYMPYVRTARFYGMIHGYNDGSARLNNNINRVELLKFALEASEAFTGYEVPSYGVSYYGDVNANDKEHAWFKDYAGVSYDYILMDERFVGNQVYLGINDQATRGEVALLLYRMNNAGLLSEGGYPVSPFKEVPYYDNQYQSTSDTPAYYYEY